MASPVTVSSSSDHESSSRMQRVIVYGNDHLASTISVGKIFHNGSGDNNIINGHSAVTVSFRHNKVPTTTTATVLNKGHVLIKVVCAGLNPVDAKNLMGDKLPHSWTSVQKLYYDKVLAGNIIGIDFSGIVQQCPCGTFQPGDHVFGSMPPFHGSLAEYIVAPLHQVAYKPKKLSFAQAAALPLVGLTALQSLSPHIQQTNNIHESNNDDDDDIDDVTSLTSSSSSSSVLIIGGSGGSGHVALQVARNLGAKHITTMCSSRNEAFCKEMGATHVVDYNRPPADLVKALQAAPGCPFDVVLDCVTSGDPRDSADHHYPSLIQDRQHGLVNSSDNNNNNNNSNNKYVYIRLGGALWDWIRAGVRRQTYGCCNMFRTPEQLFWVRFPHSSHELQQLAEWADESRLTVNLHGIYDYTPQSVQQAFDAMLSRRVQGKVVICVSSSGNNHNSSGSNNIMEEDENITVTSDSKKKSN